MTCPHTTGKASPCIQKSSALWLTPYDVLKSLALLLMLCDHIGAYLFPLDDWWRVIGRLCVPIWLFLIGYARSRRIDTPLIAAALFISILHYAVQDKFDGLNILWTIILLRLTLNPVMRWIGTSDTRLYFITFMLLVPALVIRSWLEYGTMAWILGIWGYLMRHNFTDQSGKSRPDIVIFYSLMAIILFISMEAIAFSFTPVKIAVMAIGFIPIYFGLTVYLPRNILIGGKLPPFLRQGIAFLGQHTLEFYTLHLTVLLLLQALLR